MKESIERFHKRFRFNDAPTHGLLIGADDAHSAPRRAHLLDGCLADLKDFVFHGYLAFLNTQCLTCRLRIDLYGWAATNQIAITIGVIHTTYTWPKFIMI